ncbi:alpha-hydroxy-acid oxidizing protein [Pseudooceanicola sp. CBS1P-1]|uniref:Alpha-hydroxy-acid oxidizing protein n=1 Tax=Pseudooceanicola albus TaxID=2692189 RepID=A0A6L7GE72_9RHOB|nr:MULTISPECIES: alpha-hydroxy acid oxidase [Pseudooceanicola]MBT9386893.1 alpha-hydroxy-acid oxidizing protein [Pseudooceanicola endophyticus]MXN21053.1 alpha-hydroxy-acid oxidizing protein [Pseudooceanicola albus]
MTVTLAGAVPAQGHPARPPARLRRILALEDFERAAARHLPRPIFGYVEGAAETNAARDGNRSVFAEIDLVPRVLRDVSGRDLKTPLLGRVHAAPFGIAPMGVSALSGYRGDLSLAAAADAAGLPMVISAASLIPMEEIVRVAPGAWYQAYLPPAPEAISALVARVRAAGIDTFVITVDSAVVPSRENNIRTGYRTPIRPGPKLAWDGITHPRWALGTFLRTFARHGMPHFENADAHRGAPLLSSRAVRDFSGREKLSWAQVAQVRREWPGKLVLKGILSAQDARLAREAGIDGLIVSNHGGRQLDHALSPMRALPAIVAAVPELPVMIDSGFRRGTDILKAIGLGAAFVFVGRPFNYASAIAGQPGVAHAIGILTTELRADLGMLGLTGVSEMGREALSLDRFRHPRPEGGKAAPPS